MKLIPPDQTEGVTDAAFEFVAHIEKMQREIAGFVHDGTPNSELILFSSVAQQLVGVMARRFPNMTKHQSAAVAGIAAGLTSAFHQSMGIKAGPIVAELLGHGVGIGLKQSEAALEPKGSC